MMTTSAPRLRSPARSLRFASLPGLCVLQPLEEHAYQTTNQYNTDRTVDDKPDVIVKEKTNDVIDSSDQYRGWRNIHDHRIY